jgi:hypothetical protein
VCCNQVSFYWVAGLKMGRIPIEAPTTPTKPLAHGTAKQLVKKKREIESNSLQHAY